MACRFTWVQNLHTARARYASVSARSVSTRSPDCYQVGPTRMSLANQRDDVKCIDESVLWLLSNQRLHVIWSSRLHKRGPVPARVTVKRMVSRLRLTATPTKASLNGCARVRRPLLQNWRILACGCAVEEPFRIVRPFLQAPWRRLRGKRKVTPLSNRETPWYFVLCVLHDLLRVELFPHFPH
jgi:hypothetical protein